MIWPTIIEKLKLFIRCTNSLTTSRKYSCQSETNEEKNRKKIKMIEEMFELTILEIVNESKSEIACRTVRRFDRISATEWHALVWNGASAH